MIERNLTFFGEHIMQYTYNVFLNCVVQTNKNLLTIAMPIY